VEGRLRTAAEREEPGSLRPEVETHGDGVVCVTLFVPADPDTAESAALEMAHHMGLSGPEVISRRVMHPAEGSVFEIKGVLEMGIDPARLPRIERAALLEEAEIEAWVRPRNLAVVAATVGEDEHSVGLHEILDIKHGGIEKYGFRCHALGTSISPEKLLDEAEASGACAILVSTIVTHSDVHKQQMRRLHELAVSRGLRDRLLLVAGGTQVNDEMARECHMDGGFGRGTTGRDVASFLVGALREKGA